MAEDMQALIQAMTSYMTTCMSGHDPSHNPAHVQRVVRLAHAVLEGELSRHPSSAAHYDHDIITLAATLHDIGDHKYLPPAATTPESQIDPKQMVFNVLRANGADASLAERVQTIVSNVSYSNEIKNPAAVRALIADARYRELAVVQDADRLDAIGAVGIARTFTYLGSRKKDAGQRWELDDSIEHFDEKLEKLEGIMKTDTGREMARERTRRLREFKAWWFEETGGHV
ncbi:hypothetical protein PISL3812_03450 [Talaromyces islandicus]|uniref:HD domain-containing protein n=1 Tax=Talaromyces islandicus TaxID=28573 RepID=A0A0U1LST5_TALIS|nr:hypothetical protein PISL3812_03450 [Talaromyces islandicus]